MRRRAIVARAQRKDAQLLDDELETTSQIVGETDNERRNASLISFIDETDDVSHGSAEDEADRLPPPPSAAAAAAAAADDDEPPLVAAAAAVDESTSSSSQLSTQVTHNEQLERQADDAHATNTQPLASAEAASATIVATKSAAPVDLQTTSEEPSTPVESPTTTLTAESNGVGGRNETKAAPSKSHDENFSPSPQQQFDAETRREEAKTAPNVVVDEEAKIDELLLPPPIVNVSSSWSSSSSTTQQKAIVETRDTLVVTPGYTTIKIITDTLPAPINNTLYGEAQRNLQAKTATAPQPPNDGDRDQQQQPLDTTPTANETLLNKTKSSQTTIIAEGYPNVKAITESFNNMQIKCELRLHTKNRRQSKQIARARLQPTSCANARRFRRAPPARTRRASSPIRTGRRRAHAAASAAAAAAAAVAAPSVRQYDKFRGASRSSMCKRKSFNNSVRRRARRPSAALIFRLHTRRRRRRLLRSR